jgi:hypothetical protein
MKVIRHTIRGPLGVFVAILVVTTLLTIGPDSCGPNPVWVLSLEEAARGLRISARSAYLRNHLYAFWISCPSATTKV